MLDFIAQKEFNPNGQLEKINIPSDITIWPKLLNKKIDKIDSHNAGLVCNQLDNLLSIIELASSNLIDSSRNISMTICKKLYSAENTNAVEKISVDFILNSIIYYNASFDYLRVLLKYAYSSHRELTETYPREMVEGQMIRLNLEKNWELALGLIIAKIDIKKYSEWAKDNEEISDNIKRAFSELKKMNKDLRTKYQANQLKHGAVPHFKRSDHSNLIGLKMFEGLEQFYDSKGNSYDFGVYENQLQIDEVQDFLIKYHNCTANVINETVSDIGLNENETVKQNQFK